MAAWQLFCVFSVTGDSQHLAMFLSRDTKQCPETFFLVNTTWRDLVGAAGVLLPLFAGQRPGKASIFGPSLWFNSYIPTLTAGKAIALTIQTFVGKVMSLLFNKLSRFVIAFLPMSKCLLLSWLQSPSTVILKLRKVKSVTVPIFPHLFAIK